MGIDPDAVLVVTFGLEGNTLKDELMRRTYLKAGLAMFPEIVGPVCVEAAIGAYRGGDLPPTLVTPHAVLTADTLGDFYVRQGDDLALEPRRGCGIAADTARFHDLWWRLAAAAHWVLGAVWRTRVVPSLIAAMRAYAGNLGHRRNVGRCN